MIILGKGGFWGLVWDLCELFHIKLGKHAPYVFHKAMGMQEYKPKKKGEDGK